MAPVFGGIEAGGTKFVCVVAGGPDDVRSRIRIATTDPDTTLDRCVRFFQDWTARHETLAALGVASFGPLELRPHHRSYGHVTRTPKPGWTDADVIGPLQTAFDLPIGFDTDVNGAGLAEARWGAGVDLGNFVYLTVGTGIGGGAVIDGRPIHGLIHPEMGHVTVARQEGDSFPGRCPFHGDCLEGMASGPAIEERWGRRGEDLGDVAEAAVTLEAAYLAGGIRQLVYALAPERVIVGGGVASLPGLREEIQRRLLAELAGYGEEPEHRDAFVTAPGLGASAGVLGAIALAQAAADG